MRTSPRRLALLAVLASPAALYAQNNSSMTGTITDATGAALPQSTVVLSNASTGTRFTQQTNDMGEYRFANVPPAQGYTVVFSHDGFAPSTVNGVALQVGITRTQNGSLAAGAVQQVEVSASGAEATINTTDASIGNNLDPRTLNDLPVQARSSISVLFSLQPGVANSSFTGARTDQSSVTLDGMDVNDIAAGSVYGGIGGGGTLVSGAPVDAIQEFRGTVAGLPSDLGTGSGGQFQLVTKQGTNQFHGDLNEYYRATATTANSWFNNKAGVGRPRLVQNQFGGAIGGPIQKDKLFFFFDFNNSRTIQSANVERIVPLDSFRNGIVSYIRNTDSSTGAACAATSRQNTTPNCIGQLTPAQVQSLDPQKIGESTALFSFINANYPHANDLAYASADGINTGGYRFNFVQPNYLYQYIARLDYNLTPKQRLFLRGNISRQDSVQSANAFPSAGITNPFVDRSYSYVISHIWQIGNNKVNQFYYGDTIEKFNFPALSQPTGINEYTLGGSTSASTNLFGPFNSYSSQKRRIPIPEVRDDFNWTLGAHNIGFGGLFKFIKTNSQLINDFTFATLGLGGQNLTLDASVRPTTANGYGAAAIRSAGTTSAAVYDEAFALALGRIGAVSSNYNYTPSGAAVAEGTGTVRGYRYFQTEAYVGDNWKVRKDLTLSFGLRYQLYSVPYEVHGEQSGQNTNFNSYLAARVTQSNAGKSGATTLPFVTYNLGGKANGAAPLYNPSYKDFAPRFAFAYNPGFAPKSVFNGSFALVYDRTVINAVNFIQDQSSYLFQNNATKQYGGAGAAGALGAANPRVGASLAFANPNTPPKITKPYTPYLDDGSVSGVVGAPVGLIENQFNTIVDPTLRDPYALQFNFGFQQELGQGFLFKASYVGRLGRRLLAQADASQLVDYRDATSGQLMSQAFANLTRQARAGQAYTAQPFFENQGGKGSTVLLANALSSLVQNGDFADYIQALQSYGYLDFNVGMASQFAENTYLTNKGTSAYNGLLVTVTKNLSRGVQFDFNYTWSHSLDNVSANANFIAASSGNNFICDATRTRLCYANSDFDVTHVINSNFIAQLPFGHGREFAAHTNTFVNELIGGWSVSAIPTWRSGQALGTSTNAYVAGYANNAPAFFNGNRADVQAHAKKDNAANAVYLFGSAVANTKAQAEFSGPIGLDFGSRNNLRGPSGFFMDAGLAKNFPILPNERLNLKFRADFFNVLNHPVFALPNTDITSTSFGTISSTASSARIGQFSLRLEF